MKSENEFQRKRRLSVRKVYWGTGIALERQEEVPEVATETLC